MIDYKQLASDLIAIQADAVSRNKELLERAEKGAKQCFEKDIRQNPSREDRDLYGQAARDAALGRKVREIADRRLICRAEEFASLKARAYDEIMRAVDHE